MSIVVEILVARQPLMEAFSNEVLRIHPGRIIAWNLDGPGYNTRAVGRAAGAIQDVNARLAT